MMNMRKWFRVKKTAHNSYESYREHRRIKDAMLDRKSEYR